MRGCVEDPVMIGPKVLMVTVDVTGVLLVTMSPFWPAGYENEQTGGIVTNGLIELQ